MLLSQFQNIIIMYIIIINNELSDKYQLQQFIKILIQMGEFKTSFTQKNAEKL